MLKSETAWCKGSSALIGAALRQGDRWFLSQEQLLTAVLVN
jgi:hypothetical protein